MKFKSALTEGNSGDAKKDYMQDAGSAVSRVFGGIKGALGNLQHTPYIGPKGLNGGEVVITAGECSFLYVCVLKVDDELTDG